VAAGDLEQFERLLRANLDSVLDPGRVGNAYYDQFVLDATLDALIRIGHNAVPPDLLMAVYGQRSEAAIILAAESSLSTEAIDPFLRIVLDDRPEHWLHVAWLGAADLLILHRVPGTFAAVLRDATFTAHAVECAASVASSPYETTVVALSSQTCGRVGAGYGGSWPSSIPDPSYPPWMHYDLVLPSASHGALVRRLGRGSVAPDVETVIEGRADAASLAYLRYAGTSAPPAHGPVTTADRIAVIASATPKATLPTIEGAALVVPWRDDASAHAAIERFRHTLETRYMRMVSVLRAAGTLTADEAATLAVPKILIVTDDRRNR
jgi:hypothetical protein